MQGENKNVQNNCWKVDEKGRKYCTEWVCPVTSEKGQCRQTDESYCVTNENGKCVYKKVECVTCDFLGDVECATNDNCKEGCQGKMKAKCEC